MAEMRVTHLLALLLVVGAIGFVVLTFGGWIAIGWWNKETLNKAVDTGLATASGYTPAKTPSEAMDKFHEAIQARKYKFAANYCTKDYAEYLTRCHTAASSLGAEIDTIRGWGKENGVMTDKLLLVLFRLDPFPKNFKIGPAPKEGGDKKMMGSFLWEPVGFKNQNFTLNFASAVDLQQLDQTMYNNVLLGGLQPSVAKIELVKEGEEWKLKIPTSKQWDMQINNFLDKWKTYHTGLSAFTRDLNRERYADPGSYETEITGRLRSASKR